MPSRQILAKRGAPDRGSKTQRLTTLSSSSTQACDNEDGRLRTDTSPWSLAPHKTHTLPTNMFFPPLASPLAPYCRNTSNPTFNPHHTDLHVYCTQPLFTWLLAHDPQHSGQTARSRWSPPHNASTWHRLHTCMAATNGKYYMAATNGKFCMAATNDKYPMPHAPPRHIAQMPPMPPRGPSAHSRQRPPSLLMLRNVPRLFTPFQYATPSTAHTIAETTPLTSPCLTMPVTGLICLQDKCMAAY
eukprot:jgi/Psemu1/37606/gm1.37606_g